jgi:tyrosyl-tRNA synthetase
MKDQGVKFIGSGEYSFNDTAYLGIDLTSNNLHIGHYYLIGYGLRKFHSLVLVLGDFTTLVGDPTGRTKERPKLSLKQILSNLLGILRTIKRFSISSIKIAFNST